MRLETAATMEHLTEMIKFVRDQAVLAGFDLENVNHIELAVEEAVVNIIKYGYPESEGTIEINCAVLQKMGLQIVIKDKGIAFNPLNQNISTETLQEKDSIGGYGLILIRKSIDDLSYKREGNYNVLTFLKKFPQA